MSASTTTDVNGKYVFAGLRPGTYVLVETQPATYLDGNTVGTPGGTTTNDQFSNVVWAAGVDGVDNNFGELTPASISGYVYSDTNNDGSRSSEAGIANASVTLSGTDDIVQRRQCVDGYRCQWLLRVHRSLSGNVHADGDAAGWISGRQDTIGTPGGTSSNDFSSIVLTADEWHGKQLR